MANERLISAPKLVIELAKRYNRSANNNGLICYDAVMANIADAPTVDAVEVVRCKDCKSCKMCYPEKQIDKEATPGWYCKEHKSYRRPDDFCSYGERREGK